MENTINEKGSNVFATDFGTSFIEKNTSDHLGFTDDDLITMNSRIAYYDDSGYDQLDQGVLVPFSYLVNKKKQKTAVILLKHIQKALEKDGFNIELIGFSKLSQIKIYNKDFRSDVFPQIRLDVLNFHRLDSPSCLPGKDQMVTSSAMMLLWFMYLYYKYLEVMDGYNKPFLFCKDLHVGGQPIHIRRGGKTITIEVSSVFTPKPDYISPEYIKCLTMPW